MKLLKLLKITAAVGRARFFKKKAPLVVGWAITDRCNRQCSYCDLPRQPRPEASTRQALGIIDHLAEMGTWSISFTGGEPLLRRDLGSIIEHAHQRGLETKVNSNGALVPARIEELRGLGRMNLSLEGPEEIHDAIRGKGSFREVQAAAEAARSAGIKITFATVLTRLNLEAVDYLLDKAAQGRERVLFQPATPWRLGGSRQNQLVPEQEACRAAMARLISKKKKGEQAIANSLAGLRHLYHWPRPKIMSCASGWISCRIEPDGEVRYCSREPFPFTPGNCLSVPLERAFGNLTPVACHECWCAGRVDLNLSFAPNPRTLVDQIRLLVS
ncbi:MAG: radical SAM protein [Desulfosudaceae bacterium]